MSIPIDSRNLHLTKKVVGWPSLTVSTLIQGPEDWGSDYVKLGDTTKVIQLLETSGSGRRTFRYSD